MSASRAVLAEHFRRGRWLAMARELRALNRRNGVRGALGLRGLIGLAVTPHLPAALYARYAQRHAAGAAPGWVRYSPIHPDFARDMRVEERMHALGWDSNYQPRAGRRETMAAMLDRGSRHLAGVLMMAQEAVTGVQNRDPLLDRKLAEFCYAIPDAQFYRGGADRRLIRAVMGERLPDAVLTAPRGRQSADWHLRLKRDLPRYTEELDRIEEDPAMAGKIDIARLRAALQALPEHTPMTRNDHPDLAIAMVGITRALAVARFVRAVEGRNR
jgi:asparagine synthase (glutamine-hydrolysing)